MKFKLSLILFTSILFSAAAFAQTQNNLLNIENTDTPADEANRSSALNYRIIGMKAFLMDAGVWEDSDSVAVEYSGTNGSDIATNTFNFDENVLYTWDGLIYTPSSKDIRSYGENNLVDEHLYQDYIAGDWENISRRVFTYNDDNQIANRTFQIFNGGAWEDDYRFVFIYDEGLLLTKTRQEWTGTSWENIYREVNDYNGNGNLASGLTQEWDGSTWINNVRHIYTYDGSGNVIEDVRESWESSSWQLTSRNVMQYDAEDWLTVETSQEWNGSEWDDDRRTLYTHELDAYYYSETISQNYENGGWVNTSRSTYAFTEFNRIGSTIYSTWDGTVWESLDKTIVYYEEYDDGTVGIESHEELGIEVYPNPATDYVLFKNPGKTEKMQVDVYNLNGQLVEKLSGSGEIRWNIDRSQPSGIYSYVITIGDSSQRGQIVNR